MYAKKIDYVDYNGQERSETFYFNLTKTELTQMDMVQAGGLQGYINKIIETRNGKEVMDAFNMLLSKSYGEKSLDGRRFVKSPELYKAFTETEAYNKFFYDLVTDSKAAAEFVNGVVSSVMEELPKDQQVLTQAKMEAMIAQNNTSEAVETNN